MCLSLARVSSVCLATHSPCVLCILCMYMTSFVYLCVIGALPIDVRTPCRRSLCVLMWVRCVVYLRLAYTLYFVVSVHGVTLRAVYSWCAPTCPCVLCILTLPYGQCIFVSPVGGAYSLHLWGYRLLAACLCGIFLWPVDCAYSHTVYLHSTYLQPLHVASMLILRIT